MEYFYPSIDLTLWSDEDTFRKVWEMENVFPFFGSGHYENKETSLEVLCC